MSRYLIVFDLDQESLKNWYHSATNAYRDINAVFKRHGFNNIQGSVYLSVDETISEAHGTIALQEVAARFDWFYRCVSDIRFYRLESDLDATFIVEGVQRAKEIFLQQIDTLKASLIDAGISEEKLNSILSKQIFSVGNISVEAGKIKGLKFI